MNLHCMKVIYQLSYIKHSWRFIRILLYILKCNHSQLIFSGYIYIYIYIFSSRCFDAVIDQSAEAVKYTYCITAEGLVSPNECLGYVTWSTPSLTSLPGSLWPGVVAPDRVLSMSQIKLN